MILQYYLQEQTNLVYRAFANDIESRAIKFMKANNCGIADIEIAHIQTPLLYEYGHHSLMSYQYHIRLLPKPKTIFGKIKRYYQNKKLSKILKGYINDK